MKGAGETDKDNFMNGNYSGIGLSIFEKHLRSGLDERIRKFISYTHSRVHSSELPTRTRQEWMEEYKKFSLQDK